MLNFPLCKLYSNSLISSLNSRGGWKYGTSSLPGQEIRTHPERPGISSQVHDEIQSGWKDDITDVPRNPVTKVTAIYSEPIPVLIRAQSPGSEFFRLHAPG